MTANFEKEDVEPVPVPEPKPRLKPDPNPGVTPKPVPAKPKTHHITWGRETKVSWKKSKKQTAI